MVAADTFCHSKTDILADELLAEGGKDSKYSRLVDIYWDILNDEQLTKRGKNFKIVWTLFIFVTILLYCYVLFLDYSTIIRQNSSSTFLVERHATNIVAFPYKYSGKQRLYSRRHLYGNLDQPAHGLR